MSTLSYDKLALSWSLDSRTDRLFKVIALLVLVISLSIALLISSIDLPKEERKARQEVSPRIVQLLLEKKKTQPEVEKAKPEPKPKPRPKPKPKVEKKKPETEKKPLTETQKKAREKAAESGLLALSNELSDLMETDDISAMVGGAVKSVNSGSTSSNAASEALLAGSTTGSGGVSDNQVAIVTSKKIDLQREVSSVEQKLISETTARKQKAAGQTQQRTRKAGIRSEESVTLVFDRNKSKLFALYNRARGKNPNLKGKVILELTIAPSGKVSRIIIVTSELGDKALESRLLKRIKQFDFGAQQVEQVTVTYPIEFLPS